MPYKSNNTNQQSKENHGSPASGGEEKGSGNLPVNERDEQTEQRLAEEAQDAPQSSPNRNTNKGDSGKGSYS